jgi:hypothetical protein
MGTKTPTPKPSTVTPTPNLDKLGESITTMVKKFISDLFSKLFKQ